MNDTINLTRSDFIAGAGRFAALISVAGLLSRCSTGSTTFHGVDSITVENAKTLKTPAQQVLYLGLSAASAHNTQPWKFLLRSPKEADLYVDPSRLLLETDPTTRQIHISQGTFIEHASIGAGKLGYKLKTKLFPEGKYNLANTGRKPVARISLVAASDIVPDQLYPAMHSRSTNRTVYNGPFVSAGEHKRIVSLIGKSHSQLLFINTESAMKPYQDLFLKAFRIETDLQRTYDESRQWFRYNDEEIRKFRDGISLRGNGVSGLKLFIAENFFLRPGPESWHSKANRDASVDIFHDAVYSSRGLIFFKTSANMLQDWVLTGRDYARLQLTLTNLGLVMQPMSQILQEYSEMQELNREFRKLAGLRGNQKIQMAVRIGRSDYRFFPPRRCFADFIMKG